MKGLGLEFKVVSYEPKLAVKFALCLLLLPASAFSLGTQRYVEFSNTLDAFPLCRNNSAASILTDSRDFPGVLRAVNNLQSDIHDVTGSRPNALTQISSRDIDVVVVGTLGSNRHIDQLVRAGKLDVAAVKGKWESFLIQVVKNPWPGVKRALVIVGSDKRGAIYGVYDLSEQIGVSPWRWWADVPVKHHEQLFVRNGRYLQGEPAVKYRGIFLNDEAPSLTGWVKEKYGNYNHQFYERVFELLLRLKANYLWPAMWDNAFSDDDPLNPKLADEYGIVMGTSHHEPMVRAQQEWKRYGSGPWNYATNGEKLRQFWTAGIQRNRNYENIVTLGMRGDGDLPMSAESDIELLQRIVSDQRKILAEHIRPDLNAIPQVWTLYKEVQDYYEKGMRVPDDVTLLWSDDNWGNLRRLPTADERKRQGGAGIYYHFDYVGGPRSYKWINTVPISKVQEQMNLAYNYGANRIWIVNVGDLKPMEFPIEFFLTFAWEPGKWPAERLVGYAKNWAEREFGAEHASEIADIIEKYTKYNGRRKPELLEPDTYSLVNYLEAETIQKDFHDLVRQTQDLYAVMPADERDAFYELVLYPVNASAVLNDLYITVGENRLYAVQGRTSTNSLADRARKLFLEDGELARYYNETLGNGKWRHMMDQTHIGYTYWNQPVRNAMPAVQEIQPSEVADMGVSVEGSVRSWPGGPGVATLPVQNSYDPQPQYFEVFNRGTKSFTFTVQCKERWIHVDHSRGTVGEDQRVWVSVDWGKAPEAGNVAHIYVDSSNGQRVEIFAPILHAVVPAADVANAFIESNGVVSIEAEHSWKQVDSKGMHWKRLPGFGRTLSGMTTFPVNADPQSVSKNGAHLEYKVYMFSKGEIKVNAYFAPTQEFLPGTGRRYAVSFDDDPPQVINIHEGYTQAEWERSVKDSIRIKTSKHQLVESGTHILNYWVLDSGLVLEKLVIDNGAEKPTYLGPPESLRSSAVK